MNHKVVPVQRQTWQKSFQIKIVSDNLTFAKCVKIIKNRKELTDEKIQELEEVVMDSAKARAIIDASKASMGMDISVLDLMNIELFATRVIDLAEYRYKIVVVET